MPDLLHEESGGSSETVSGAAAELLPFEADDESKSVSWETKQAFPKSETKSAGNHFVFVHCTQNKKRSLHRSLSLLVSRFTVYTYWFCIQNLLLSSRTTFISDVQMTGRGSNLKSAAWPMTCTVFICDEIPEQTEWTWIFFCVRVNFLRSVEDAEIEASAEWFPTLIPQDALHSSLPVSIARPYFEASSSSYANPSGHLFEFLYARHGHPQKVPLALNAIILRDSPWQLCQESQLRRIWDLSPMQGLAVPALPGLTLSPWLLLGLASFIHAAIFQPSPAPPCSGITTPASSPCPSPFHPTPPQQWGRSMFWINLAQ